MENRKEYMKEWRIRNKDKIEKYKEKNKERCKQYYLKNKEKRQQYLKEWGKKNRDKKNILQQRYRANHKDKIKQETLYYKEKYLREKPEILKFYNLKASARIRNKPFLLNKEDFSKWYKEQKKECIYCHKLFSRDKKENWLSVDRKDNKKGYEIDNICFCCYKCNCIKNSLFTFENMLKIGEMIKENREKEKIIPSQ